MGKQSRHPRNFIGGVLCGALLLGTPVQGIATDMGRDTSSINVPSITFTAGAQPAAHAPLALDAMVLGMPVPCREGNVATGCAGTGAYRYIQSGNGQATDRLSSGTARRDDGVAIVTAGDVNTAFDSTDPRNGLGTRSFSAGYKLLGEKALLPQVRAAVQLNFLTLDQHRGVGRGEYDAALSLNLDKWFGKWNLFTEGSYIFLGESDLSGTLDYVNYTAGIGYQLRNNLYLALVGNGAAARIEGFQEPIEGGVRINWMFLEKMGLESYGAKGLTAGASDYTASLTVFRLF